MPVQINEVIVRANIVERPEKVAVTNTGKEEDINKDEIVKECAELVLEILKSRIER